MGHVLSDYRRGTVVVALIAGHVAHIMHLQNYACSLYRAAFNCIQSSVFGVTYRVRNGYFFCD